MNPAPFRSKIFTIVAMVLLSTPAFCQKKSLEAGRTEEKLKIDGFLNETAWDAVEAGSGFIQNRPNPGSPSTQKTEVKILYDDDALYVGAMLYDSAPDSILSQLSNRDNMGNSDSFGIIISCFQDGINAFQFTTTPSGVQIDAQVSAFGEDTNWNAVWQCNTQITDKGWSVEMKIPYSAIRFPSQDVQTWDLNLFRSIRRLREQSFWQHVDPKVPGLVRQSGELTGIRDIEPPPRLFFYPYASGYVQVEKTGSGEVVKGSSYNGGMDVKLGLNDAFTLDMTLIPDFGQVQSDNNVLNLSPFEVQFQENRQFFTEGTELFSKGNLFYSRRIGGEPVNRDAAFDALTESEEITSLPTTTSLINASKISGRNKNGLGIGFFNAVTGREYATVQDTLTGLERSVEISPLVNYNIFVLDQNLPNNSYVTLVNTNVLRDGSTYDANVTGTSLSLRNKSNSISIRANTTYNKKFNWVDDKSDDGFAYNFGIAKVSGQFNFGGGHNVKSKYFDKNDLGFLFNANEISSYLWAGYNIFEPFGRFNSLWSNLNISASSLYEPHVFTGLSVDGNVGVTSRKFHTFNAFFNFSPTEGYDYFGPRKDSSFFVEPKDFFFGGWVSTDYRKRVACDFMLSYGEKDAPGWHDFNWRVAPRFRINDQLMLTYVYSRQNEYNQSGWNSFNGDEIIYAIRDVTTHTHVLSANYIFNNRMGLTFRLRHYWSFVENKKFLALEEDGSLGTTDFQGFNDDGSSPFDVSFNAFNIDMVYTWVFAPGSELRVVWKNSISDFSSDVPESWTNNFSQTLGLPQTNSFSIKVLYFVDYLSFLRKEKMILN